MSVVGLTVTTEVSPLTNSTVTVAVGTLVNTTVWTYVPPFSATGTAELRNEIPT